MFGEVDGFSWRAIRLGFIILILAILAMLAFDAFMPKPPIRPKKTVLNSEQSNDREVSMQAGEERMETPRSVQPCVLAERGWYPADAETLRKQIAGYFEKALVAPREDAIAVILPHAGYAYSGQTAAYGLRAAAGKYKRVITIGPSHYMPMNEIFSVPRVTHYQTPLGLVPLDAEFIDKLLEHPIFQNVPRAHLSEHSVQIELPLLQYAFDDFKFVPIVAGQCSAETIRRAAAILSGLVDEATLVVASSDFVHYGPNYGYVPFTGNVPEEIKKLDMGAYERIAALDTEGFLGYKQKTGATICGAVPIAVLLSMLEPDTQPELVNYTTSGELTGDFKNSVSYLSVVFSGEWRNRSAVEAQKSNTELSEEDRRQLLVLARKTIEHYLENRRLGTAEQFGIVVSDAMKVPRAAFVTLQKRGMLRGCIGDIFPRQPLYKSVITNVVNACVNDRRFVPVKKDELEDITIEISALTVPVPVESWEKIRIGTDGVVLNKGGRSAVFLPQVAPEQGWDVNEMLTHLSLKAGLAPDGWREGASFLVFQAEVFGEHE